MNLYHKRDLRLMGFASYESYLKSDLWAWVASRLAKLSRNDRCARCGSPTGLVWHHRVYTLDVLIGNFRAEGEGATIFPSEAPRQIDPIVRLCGECHRFVHFDDSGAWIADLQRVDLRLLEDGDRRDFSEFEEYNTRDGGKESP